MKMLLLPKAPLDLHVAANLSENWRILNEFSQADFEFSHETSLVTTPYSRWHFSLHYIYQTTDNHSLCTAAINKEEA